MNYDDARIMQVSNKKHLFGFILRTLIVLKLNPFLYTNNLSTSFDKLFFQNPVVPLDVAPAVTRCIRSSPTLKIDRK